MPVAAGQEALPGRLAGGAGGCQLVPGEQPLQKALQALQQLPPALLPVGQLWREQHKGKNSPRPHTIAITTATTTELPPALREAPRCLATAPTRPATLSSWPMAVPSWLGWPMRAVRRTDRWV